jgi:hypothetical protein
VVNTTTLALAVGATMAANSKVMIPKDFRIF